MLWAASSYDLVLIASIGIYWEVLVCCGGGVSCYLLTATATDWYRLAGFYTLSGNPTASPQICSDL